MAVDEFGAHETFDSVSELLPINFSRFVSTFQPTGLAFSVAKEFERTLPRVGPRFYFR